MEKQEAPKVGDGATYSCWTDRTAATVVEVSADGKTVVVQDDKTTRVDKNGMSECQDYAYAADPEGRKLTFTLRKNGRYNEQGCAMGKGNRVSFGFRRAYHDYSF